ncbi:hypothetical protein ACTFIW_000017 [Dictyostelium discoideum]
MIILKKLIKRNNFFRPHQPSFRDESQTIVQSTDASVRISHEQSNIPRSIDQTISRVNTNPNSTKLGTGDYSTFQSHVMSIIRIKKSSTAELLMKSWNLPLLSCYSLGNQTDIVNDLFITRIMTGIHKMRPSSTKYQEIWNANQVF